MARRLLLQIISLQFLNAKMTFSKPKYCPNKFLLLLIPLFIAAAGNAQPVRILFDATKAEMAGNADWVIDADQTNVGIGTSGPYMTSPGHQSNPQQIPTPAQSGITSSTPETYWTGALSSWAVDCAKKGYTVETLPWNSQITYGNSGNAQDLSNYKIFIVDEPNLVFADGEKTALIQFVQNGGSLFIISDHDNSDRNGDGWDSPHIWNDFFSNNTFTVNPFGITFDIADISQTTTNISATATDSIIHGPMGNVTKVQWSGGTTMTLDPSKNPSVKGVIFKNGATPGNTNAMVAYGRYGNGKIAAIGDSSPTDDGTGNPTCTLYTGYTGDASGNHRLLLMNITIWLAGNEGATDPATGVVNNIAQQEIHTSVYPNPSAGSVHFSADNAMTNATITVYNIMGVAVMRKTIAALDENEEVTLSLTRGFYYIKAESDQAVTTTKVTVY